MLNDNIITSVSNSEVKAAASLHQKKYRNQTKLYLAEGFRLINDTIAAGFEPEKVFVSQSSQAYISGWKHIDKNLHKLVLVTDSVLKKICDTESPQGIAAIFYQRVPQKFAPSNCNLLLDRISDPGNLGTILRSAAACGFNNILLYNCTDPYSPKCVRSAMSALSYTAIYEFNSAQEMVSAVCGTQIVCADMQGGDLFSKEVRDRLTNVDISLVIGSEAHGTSPEILHQDNICTVSLPMHNIESLNAAVCASVMMYTINYGINNNK